MRVPALLLLLLAPAPAFAGVVINEFIANPAGGDTGFEWVEVLNNGPTAVDITGWKFQVATSTFSTKHTFAGTVLKPGERWLIGEVSVPGTDETTGTLGMGNAGSSGDAIRLLDAADAVMDTVVYGPDNGGFNDDSGQLATTFAPVPGDDEAFGRIPDGTDTDESGLDFQVSVGGTPGQPNTSGGGTTTGGTGTTGTGDCDTAGAGKGLVINEFLPDPDSSDDGKEWIELYNGASGPVDVTGWKVLADTSSPLTTSGVTLSGTIGAGAYYLIAQSEVVAGADLYFPDFSLGNASTSADILQLQDCNGNPADTVVYGDPNSDEWLDDGGAIAASLAPKAGSDESVARIEDGYDTDQCAQDFAINTAPTPGAANPVIAPVICTPSTGDVVLNELLADADGTDDGYEWVELYNRGTTDVNVGGWYIDAATSAFSEEPDVVLPGDAVVPAGGWLLVGGTYVTDADVYTDALSVGNASTSGAAVRLVDCAFTTVDTVVYGANNDYLFLGDDGAVADPAEVPGERQSLAREADGVDTDAPADWVVRGTPSPGETNLYVAPEIPEQTGGCGCGGPGAGAPAPGGCSTVPVPVGAPLLLAAALAARRRRR